MSSFKVLGLVACFVLGVANANDEKFGQPTNLENVKLEKTSLGNEGSHGGDPTLNDYINIQREAVKVLRQIDISWLGDIEQRYQDFFEAFNSNKEMANDLEDSPVDLREKNPNSKCGYTNPSPVAQIWISRELCPKFNTLSFNKRITTMFIGEAAHHFGADDTFASGFAVAVYNAYLRGAPITGKWSNFTNEDDQEKIEFNISYSDTHKDGLTISLKMSTHLERYNIPTWGLKSKTWNKIDGIIYVKGTYSHVFADNTRIDDLPFSIKLELNPDGKSANAWFYKPAQVYKNNSYKPNSVPSGPYTLLKVDKLFHETNSLPLVAMSELTQNGYYKGADRFYGFNLEVYEDSREILLTFPKSGTVKLLKCGLVNYCYDKEGNSAMVFPEGILLRWPGENEGVMYFKDSVESFSEPYFAGPKACDMKLIHTFNPRYAVLFYSCIRNTSSHYTGAILQYYKNDNIWKVVGENTTLKFLKDGRFIYTNGRTTYLMSEK